MKRPRTTWPAKQQRSIHWAPRAYRQSTPPFTGLISSYQSFYAKTAAEAASWNKTDFQSVEALRQAVLKDSSTCVSSWPAVLAPIKNETAWCVTLSSDLKKLAESKKTPTPSPTSTVVVVGGLPIAGGQVLLLPSTGGRISYNPNAGYVAQMRSLLGGYKSLRGDLNKATDVYDSGGGISFGMLDNAVASRRNILSAIQSLSPPAEYAGAHQLAIQTIATGIDAVTAFRNYPETGGRQTLHNFSETNSGHMEQLQRVYGF